MSLRDVAVSALADRPRFASDREWAEKVVDALLELVQSNAPACICAYCRTARRATGQPETP